MSGFKQLANRDALTLISHPVSIITARQGEKINGMTAAWVCEVSSEPPMLCVSIHPKRYTWQMLENSEFFGVCMLHAGQEKLAEAFGTASGRKTDKFEMLKIEPFLGKNDIPLIPGSLAAMVCKKIKSVEAGDHFAVFGEVIEAWKGPEARPLKWFKSKFDR